MGEALKKSDKDIKYPLSNTDLYHIRGMAIKFMKESDPMLFKNNYSSPVNEEAFRTYAYTQAVIAFLRSKELIDFTVSVKKQKWKK